MSSDTFLYNSLFFKIGIREDFTNNHLWTYKTFGKKKLDFMGAARKKCWAWKTSPWLFAKKIIRGLNRLHKSPKVQPPPFSDLPPPFFGHLGVFLVAGEKNEFFSPLSLTKKTTFLARRFVKSKAKLEWDGRTSELGAPLLGEVIEARHLWSKTGTTKNYARQNWHPLSPKRVKKAVPTFCTERVKKLEIIRDWRAESRSSPISFGG